MGDTYQIHNLYGDVAVLSDQDRVGAYIDQELEVFRSEDDTAEFRIRVCPLESLDGGLRPVSQLEGIQYCVHGPSGERYVGSQGAFWRFDELGGSLIHVFYGPQASSGWVWTIIEQWMKVAFLQRGWMAVHSCAFVYQNVPVVVAGWQGLGKTVLLHHALAHDASYVSEDFTLVSASGEVRGYPPAAPYIYDSTLRRYTRTGIASGFCSAYGRMTEFMSSIASGPVLGRAIRAVGRRLHRGETFRRMRMEVLHPGLKVVLRASAALWVILLPVGAGSKEPTANVHLLEAAERIVAGTMTDHYFSGQYDRFLYQAGQRAVNDQWILTARETYRNIALSALEKARAVWTVDASTVFSDPDHLLALIQNLAPR